MVGVLLLSNDGNYNDKDIKYGQYITSCKRKYFQIILYILMVIFKSS